MSDLAKQFIEALRDECVSALEHTEPEEYSTSRDAHAHGYPSYAFWIKTNEGRYLRIVVSEVTQFTWDLAKHRQGRS